MGKATAGRPVINKDPSLRRIYNIYMAMKERCYSPNSKGYKNYGARGIYVCDRWLASFWNFYDDMGPRPNRYVIDRIDNDGPYSPENCEWATYFQSASNRRNCIYVYDGNERITIKEYCRRHDLNYRAITKRIRKGEDPMSAASRPVAESTPPITDRQAFAIRALSAYGEPRDVISKRLGIARSTVNRVMNKGAFKNLDVERIRAEIRAQWCR